MGNIQISDIDIEHLKIIRENVVSFMMQCASKYASGPGKLLDIAPQNHEGARPFFKDTVYIDTLDIDPASGCTFIGDICRHNDSISDSTYDFVVCSEVLEHTSHPFQAVDEIFRILKPGGFLFLTVPFNFRIHGPLPDCWRFTEHGLRELMKKFNILELHAEEKQDRPLMPIQYKSVAQKPHVDNVL